MRTGAVSLGGGPVAWLVLAVALTAPASKAAAEPGPEPGLAAQTEVLARIQAQVEDSLALRSERLRRFVWEFAKRERFEPGDDDASSVFRRIHRRAFARRIGRRWRREEAAYQREAGLLEATRQAHAAWDGGAESIPEGGLHWPVVRNPSGSASEVARPASDGGGGVVLEVDIGASVVSPMSGRIRLVGPIEGLGVCVVVQQGAWWTVVGPLRRPTLAAGAYVRAQQVLGETASRGLRWMFHRRRGPVAREFDPRVLDLGHHKR